MRSQLKELFKCCDKFSLRIYSFRSEGCACFVFREIEGESAHVARAQEQVAIDESANNMKKKIQELINSGVPIDGDTAQKINELRDTEKQIIAEYDRTLALKEQLNSTSIIFNIKNMRISNVFKKKQPSMYKIYTKNRDKDFLILLNTYLLSNLQMKEKYLSVVHETLHFINTCLGYKFTYTDIEKKSNVIVGEYLTRQPPRGLS